MVSALTTTRWLPHPVLTLKRRRYLVTTQNGNIRQLTTAAGSNSINLKEAYPASGRATKSLTDLAGKMLTTSAQSLPLMTKKNVINNPIMPRLELRVAVKSATSTLKNFSKPTTVKLIKCLNQPLGPEITMSTLTTSTRGTNGTNCTLRTSK